MGCDLLKSKKRFRFLQGWTAVKTRQRHDRDQTENQQNAATVDSCFELVGSRKHGVAQQKAEHQRESSVLPNARGSRFRMGPNSDIRPRHSA